MSIGKQWGLPVLLLVGFIPAGLLFVQGPSADAETSEGALRILITVLSILTGFLLATMTMLGDPGSLLAGSWRIASAETSRVRKAINRLAVLFYVYLTVILGVFVGMLLEGHVPECIHRWVTHGAICLGISALIWSFGLPWAVRERQLRRLRREVEERRTTKRSEPLPKPSSNREP